MAQLKFDGIQPVCFGGRDCMPKIDTELRLRLRELKTDTDAQAEKAYKVLAECFPDDEEYVAKFLKDQMTPFEIQELRTYLFAGPGGIRMLDKQISEAMGKTMEDMKDE